MKVRAAPDDGAETGHKALMPSVTESLQWILTGGKVSNFRWEFRTLIRIASLTASATGGYVM